MAFAGGATLAACDPCAGVAACTTAPRVAAQGRIVDVVDGHAIPGTRIYLVRSDSGSSSNTPADSATTVTDAEGNFQVELGSGPGKFDIIVAPPALPSYRVRDLALTSSTRRGEGNVLGVWVNMPVFSIAGELFYRATNELVRSGTVTFKRTGGVAISGGDVHVSSIDGAGRADLLQNVFASGADDVIGELTVNLPGAFGTSVLTNFHLTPSYVFRPASVRRFGVGPTLSWFYRVYNRATVNGAPNTTVTFTRTGGIPTSAESFTATTDKDGNFFVPLLPLAQGTVVGNLTISPPPPFHSYVISGLQIPTLDADGVRFLPGFGVGPHLPWLGTVTCGGKLLPNTRVIVVRVGGLSVPPNQLDTKTDADGRFDLSVFKPTEYGTMILDLEFFPPSESSCIGLVHHGLQLPTLDFDSDKRFIANWDLPKP
ncbi:MAG: hypothetical protein JWM41_3885 [Gemmatimonadetes bacterium]|nr:hypothetical protein [Gemmatimonadota bacterium]